jgi:hypothetical protein
VCISSFCAVFSGPQHKNTHDRSSKALLTEFPKQGEIEHLSVFDDIKMAEGYNIFFLPLKLGF